VGASVQACGQFDPACTPALFSTTSDDAGVVTVTLPAGGGVQGYGATGYLAIDASAREPQLFFWGFPLSEPSFPSLYDQVPTWTYVDVIAGAVGVTLAQELGTLALIATDCTGSRAPGVRFDVNPKDQRTELFYVSNGKLPSKTATSTDASGVALVANVPVGTLTITAFPDALGGKPSASLQVLTRANAETVAIIVPNQ
jgi:hypothetical protein